MNSKGEENVVSVSQVDLGWSYSTCINPSSTTYMSFENRLTIRPIGVVSKNDIGACSTASSISENSCSNTIIIFC